jgi:hypothetical protein
MRRFLIQASGSGPGVAGYWLVLELNCSGMLEHRRRQRQLALNVVVTPRAVIARHTNILPIALNRLPPVVARPISSPGLRQLTMICRGSRSTSPTSRLAAEAATAYPLFDAAACCAA